MTKLFKQEEIDKAARENCEYNQDSLRQHDKHFIGAFKDGVEFAESRLSEKFPNGITSYLETFYEVVNKFNLSWDSDLFCYNSDKLTFLYDNDGIGALYTYAEELTDEFELLNKDRKWNGEFFEEINEFLNNKLYEVT